MQFTELLRQEAEPIFVEIARHPFVRGIADGALRREQLIHYVKQDYEYLTVFLRVYGIAIGKSRSREEIQFLHEQIGFILNSETHPHRNFCRIAQVNYEDLQGNRTAPTAQHYTRHLLAAAYGGSMGELIAALLPCPWMYLEIGQRLFKKINPGPDHPFYEWITFYANRRVEDNTLKFRSWLDRLAQRATMEEQKIMKELFLCSCQLEYMFFDMAYKLEEWPVTTK